MKRLKKKRVDTSPLAEVIRLVCENTPESCSELRRRHNMHSLRGEWADSEECHVANVGDWLCVWATGDGLAVFERPAAHEEIFG